MRNVVVSRLYRMIGILGLLFLSLGCSCSFLTASPPKEEDWPSWSPDSRQLVYECYLDGPTNHDSLLEPEGPHKSFYTVEAADLCISDVNKRDRVRLADDPGGDWRPIWSPDGSQIAYLRKDGIYLITPDGQNQRQLLPLKTLCEKLGDCPLTKEAINMTWSPVGDGLLLSGCLDHSDQDIYVVDTDTGAVTNLTPDSRADDFSPMWTLDGSKIVFLSTDSLSPYGCGPEKDTLPQIKVMNADGSEERVVYDPEFYYPYWQVSVSNSGQIVFVTNMSSRTYDEYNSLSAKYGDLYEIDLVEGTLVEMLAAVDDRDRIVLPAWSPNEEYVAYLSSPSDLRILNVGTEEVLEPREQPLIGNELIWSPDSQKIAVTVSKHESYAIDSEEHIYVFDLQSQTFQPLIQEQTSP